MINFHRFSYEKLSYHYYKLLKSNFDMYVMIKFKNENNALRKFCVSNRSFVVKFCRWKCENIIKKYGLWKTNQSNDLICEEKSERCSGSTILSQKSTNWEKTLKSMHTSKSWTVFTLLAKNGSWWSKRIVRWGVGQKNYRIHNFS